MLCGAAFKKAILLKCYGALERRSFTRFRKQDVDWPIHDGFHAWVGLNAALDSDRVDLIPLVGLYVVPIERLWTSLTIGKWPGKYDRGSATYSVNMETVEAVADERAFAFAPQQSEGFIDSECDRLARIYATGGLDYARSVASYEALLPLFREEVNWLGAFPERYASCLYLMGRKGEARAFVEEFLPKKREYFEEFATPFLKMLDEEGVR